MRVANRNDAPRSQRQTEIDPGEPDHSQDPKSTGDLRPHISAISAQTIPTGEGNRP